MNRAVVATRVAAVLAACLVPAAWAGPISGPSPDRGQVAHPPVPHAVIPHDAGPSTRPAQGQTSPSPLSAPRFDAMEQAGWSKSPLTGRPAPDFALADEQGRTVRLSEVGAGRWVVLYFYPSDDTPGCTCQATDFTHQMNEFAELDAIVLGVSPDAPEQHRSFRQKYGLAGLTLLSDVEGKVMRRYGAWAEAHVDGQSFGRPLRSTFVIGPDGRIRRHWPEVMPQGHVTRVREFLRSERLRVASQTAPEHPGGSASADQVRPAP